MTVAPPIPRKSETPKFYYSVARNSVEGEGKEHDTLAITPTSDSTTCELVEEELDHFPTLSKKDKTLGKRKESEMQYVRG